MAIYYVDPVGGNDSNSGQSFAARKRTLTAATTAASVGDQVRIMKSPDPFSIGNATWTDGSREIAFTNNAIKTVDRCVTGWVAAPNVGITYVTTYRMIDPVKMRMLVAGAFTTGKAAYKTLAAPLDLSAFTQLCFWLENDYWDPLIDIRVCLCSDTTGDVIEKEFRVVSTSTTFDDNSRMPFVLMPNGGGSIGSTPINSVAFYIDRDLHTTSGREMFLSNIFACLAPDDPNLIDVFTLFSKGTEAEPEWYPIWEVTETGVLLGTAMPGALDGSTLKPKPYRGVTETVTTYARNPTRTGWATADSYITKGSTSVPGLDISGGWDSTAMDTQDGQTWLSSEYGRYSRYGMYSSDNYAGGNSIRNIGFCHCRWGVYGLNTYNLNTNWSTYEFLGFLAVYDPIVFNSFQVQMERGWSTISIPQIWGHGVTFRSPPFPTDLHIKRIHGWDGSAYSAAFGLGYQNLLRPSKVVVEKVDNCTAALLVDSQNPLVEFDGIVLENNDKNLYLSQTQGTVEIRFNNMADITGTGTWTAFNYLYRFAESNIGGDPTKHRQNLAGRVLFESSTEQVNTPGGLSWKMCNHPAGGFYFNQPTFPARFELAQIAVQAGTQVTVTCKVYIASLPEGESATAGVGLCLGRDTFVNTGEVLFPADNNTLGSWQTVTMTFTPAQAGIVPIYAYGHASQSGFVTYFDDLTAVQV